MLEADTVIGIITANGTLSDGVTLFEKDTHKNFIDVGAAIAIDSLGAARVKLMWRAAASNARKPLRDGRRLFMAPQTHEFISSEAVQIVVCRKPKSPRYSV